MQLPPRQLKPKEHEVQRSPRAPHAFEALPSSQVPAALQHPVAHVWGEQRLPVSHADATRRNSPTHNTRFMSHPYLQTWLTARR